MEYKNGNAPLSYGISCEAGHWLQNKIMNEDERLIGNAGGDAKRLRKILQCEALIFLDIILIGILTLCISCAPLWDQ